MPAEAVDAGELDVQTVRPQRKTLTPPASHDFAELLAYLQSTHTADYVYRGQTKIWPGPLVPSLYRGMVAPETVASAPNLRLRETGRVFHAVSTDKEMAPDPKFMRRIQFNAQLIQIFGYPFGSILAQQCGVTSEGLDVTHDPEVAAFFAIFDYPAQNFRQEDTGVIYRLRLPPASTGNKDFRSASFYDCTSVISAWAVFHQLRKVATWREAVTTFTDYGYAFTVKQTRPRPLHLLALPQDAYRTCRVVQQRAGLLFPDVVLPQEYNLGQIKPPAGKAEWQGPMLIEDVAAREGVEIFTFRHHPKNKYQVPLSPRVLFPPDDGVTQMLHHFFASNPLFAFLTEFGPVQGTDTSLIH
jgi:hypothetical protein